MATTLLRQIEAWKDELCDLRDGLDGHALEELETSVETLQEELLRGFDRNALKDLRTSLKALTREFRKGRLKRVIPSPESDHHAYVGTGRFGIIERFNASAERILHLTGRSLQGQPLLVFIAEEQRLHFLRDVERFSHEVPRRPVQWFVTLRPLSAPRTSVLLEAIPIEDQDGNLIRITWLFSRARSRRPSC